MTIAIVAGALANKPANGGEAWVRLSWVLGLRRLGLDVYLVEQIDPATCLAHDGRPVDFDASFNVSYFESVIEEFGLIGRAALVNAGTLRTRGLPYRDVVEVAEAAELLVNISGHLEIEAIARAPRRKAYVDLDPGFTQFWHASGELGSQLHRHDHFFTVGENVGTPGCAIPTDGIHWLPLPPPVVLDEWPPAPAVEASRLTTVGSFRSGYGRVEHAGRTYGLKAHELRRFAELPGRAPGSFEMALDIHPADAPDRVRLERGGWRLLDPRAVVPDPGAFRGYVQGSGAEFSVAQGIYVETCSGWFSDRTVRYLASGKPALVQDTGFGQNHPVGEGLLAFSTLDEAVEGAERILRDYEGHRQAARTLAEERFDSDLVLGRFLDAVGVTP